MDNVFLIYFFSYFFYWGIAKEEVTCVILINIKQKKNMNAVFVLLTLWLKEKEVFHCTNLSELLNLVFPCKTKPNQVTLEQSLFPRESEAL